MHGLLKQVMSRLETVMLRSWHGSATCDSAAGRKRAGMVVAAVSFLFAIAVTVPAMAEGDRTNSFAGSVSPSAAPPPLSLEVVKVAADRRQAEIALRSQGDQGEKKLFLDEEPLPVTRDATFQVPLHPGEILVTGTVSANGASFRTDIVLKGPPVELDKAAVRTVVQQPLDAQGVLSPDSRYLVLTWKEFAGVWDARSNLLQRKLSGHKGYVSSAAFSAGSKLLVTGAEDAVRIWRLRDGQLTAQFPAENPVTTVAISPDLQRVAALERGPAGSKLVLWETATGVRRPSSLDIYDGSVSLAFSPDSAQLALAMGGYTFLVDSRTGQETSGYLPLTSPVVYAADGGTLTGSAGRTRIDLKSGEVQDLAAPFKGLAVQGQLLFSSDGSWAADVAGDSLRIYRTSQPGQPAYSFPFGGTGMFSDNSRFLYVMTGGGEVKIDLESGRALGSYRPAQANLEHVNAVAFGTDQLPLISTYHGVLRVTPQGPLENSTLQFSSDPFEFAVILPGQNLVASAHWIGGGVAWSDAMSGKVVRSTRTENGAGLLTSIEASPDGRLVSVARADSWVDVFNSADGTPVLRIKGTDIPQATAFAPDGASLVVGYGGGSADALVLDGFPTQDLVVDHRLHIRSLPKGTVLRYLEGHTAQVTGVAWSRDGAYIASSGADGSLRLWDANSGKLLTSTASPAYRSLRFLAKSNLLVATGAQEPVLHLYRVPDLTLVSQAPLANTAGSLAVNDREDRLLTAENQTATLWQLPELKVIATFLPVAGNGYLVYSPDGYYMSSGASGALAFDVGGRMAPFDEFDLRFNRPDLILKRLGAGDAASIAAFETIYRKRLSRHGLTAQAAESPAPLPEVRVDQWSQQGDRVTLELSGAGHGQPVRAFKVWDNGVPAFGRGGAAPLSSDGSGATAKLEVQLSAGVNHLEIAAVDASGVESIRESLDLFRPGLPEKPVLHVLAAGVSQYEQKEHNLVYADKDATDIASLFQRQSGFRYRSVTADIKTNGSARRADLLQSLEKLRNVPVNDYVVIFLAGHGLLDNKLDYYFATADTDFAKPSQSAISFSELEDALYAIPARHKILLIDSCHAGEVDTSTYAASASNQPQDLQEVAMTATGAAKNPVVVREVPRGRVTLAKISGRQGDDQLEALLGDLRRGSGASIVSASAGQQFSYESDKYRNGIFTHELVHGVETGEADLNGDGSFDVSELRSYVETRVVAATGGRQRPTSRGRDMVEQRIANLNMLVGSDQVHPLSAPSYQRKAAPIAAQGRGGLAAAAVGEFVRLYDLDNGTLATVLPVLPRQEGKAVSATDAYANTLLALAADGTALVALGSRWGSVVKLADRSNRYLDLRGAYLHAAAMAPDGTLLLVQDPRTSKELVRELRMLDPAGNDLEIHQLAKQLPSFVHALHISDDHSVASAACSEGGDDYRIITWEVNTGRLLWERKSRFVLSVALSPDGKSALVTLPPRDESGSEGEGLVLLDARSGTEKARLAPPRDGAPITALSIAPDGTTAAVATVHAGLHGANLGRVDLLALPGLQRLSSGLMHHGWVKSLGFGNNGSSIITSTEEGKVSMWNISSLLGDLRLRSR